MDARIDSVKIECGSFEHAVALVKELKHKTACSTEISKDNVVTVQFHGSLFFPRFAALTTLTDWHE